MKKIKKILIFLIILVLFIIITIFLLYKKDGENDKKNNKEYIGISEEEDVFNKFTLVDNPNEFFNIENIGKKYISYLKKTKIENVDLYELYGKQSLYFTEKEEQEYIDKAIHLYKTKLLNLLDREYIEEFNINDENIEKLECNEYVTTKIYKMMSEENINVREYILCGKLYDSENKTVNLIIRTDEKNNTFSIFPNEYFIKKGYDNKLIENIKRECKKLNIDSNDDNIYTKEIFSTEKIVEKYFNSFKNNIISNVNIAYEMLDKDYQSTNFLNINDFKEAINNKKILGSKIEKYQVNKFDGYTQYICIDNNDNYYIFNETGINEYTVLLDEYTVDLPQFIEKYEKATDQEKVILNIDKFFKGLNNKNYQFVYNMLSKSFKEKNYGRQEKFEEYMTKSLFEKCEVKYDDFRNEGDIYIYDIIITNTNESNSNNEIKMQIIMQLGEGTDFVMSFSIE